MKTRIFITILVLLVVFNKLIGQEIHGFVIDSVSKQPLSYANIGVVNIPKGTVTNEFGEYNLSCEKLPLDCKIQISMIGYESKTIDLNELKTETKSIRLVKKPIELDEVTIKWKENIKKIGTTKTAKIAGVCGWGGTDRGKGHEIGLLLKLGDETIKIEDVNLKIRKHSFDTIVFRLHIRTILNELPYDELLTQNIYLPIIKYRGWQKVDLSAYNIFISGDVALSIEWIKASNVIEKNLIKMNGAKKATPNVLFDTNNKSGTFFIRRGSAANWKSQKNNSPGFYITIKE